MLGYNLLSCMIISLQYLPFLTSVMAPVFPQGELDHGGELELVGEIFLPDPAQNQPNTILGWRLGSV